MRGASQFGKPMRMDISFLRGDRDRWLGSCDCHCAGAAIRRRRCTVRRRRPPSAGTSLAPPPSVTSLAGRHLPPALPSVTSIPNYGFTRWNPYATLLQRALSRSRLRLWLGAGLSYAVPYYIPLDASGYGYDYVGGAGLIFTLARPLLRTIRFFTSWLSNLARAIPASIQTLRRPLLRRKFSPRNRSSLPCARPSPTSPAFSFFVMDINRK